MANADCPKLTILTPVYNRANLLPRVFACLKNQTDTDFEWIIIDDGSNDNSLAVAHSFVTNKFCIQVLSKPNGGKHTALNYAHPYIQGKFLIIVDSDDYLLPNAVESIKKEWNKYIRNPSIGMLVFQRGKDEEHPFCTVEHYNQPLNLMQCKRKILLSLDCAEVIRSDLFKKFPFPEFPGEKFIGESALWERIGRNYKCVYINQIIYICEYLGGGLTKLGRSLRIKNPLGGMYIANLKIASHDSLLERLKQGLLYTCYGKFAHFTWREMLKECSCKWIFFVTCLSGIFLYFYWKKKY